MQSTDVMVTIMMDTDCVWSSHGAAEVPGEGEEEGVMVESVALPGVDMDLHPDARSTESSCQVGPVNLEVARSNSSAQEDVLKVV